MYSECAHIPRAFTLCKTFFSTKKMDPPGRNLQILYRKGLRKEGSEDPPIKRGSQEAEIHQSSEASSWPKWIPWSTSQVFKPQKSLFCCRIFLKDLLKSFCQFFKNLLSRKYKLWKRLLTSPSIGSLWEIFSQVLFKAWIYPCFVAELRKKFWSIWYLKKKKSIIQQVWIHVPVVIILGKAAGF